MKLNAFIEIGAVDTVQDLIQELKEILYSLEGTDDTELKKELESGDYEDERFDSFVRISEAEF